MDHAARSGDNIAEKSRHSRRKEVVVAKVQGRGIRDVRRWRICNALRCSRCGEFARFASRRICRKTHPAVIEKSFLSSSPSAPIGDPVSLDPCYNWLFRP